MRRQPTGIVGRWTLLDSPSHQIEFVEGGEYRAVVAFAFGREAVERGRFSHDEGFLTLRPTERTLVYPEGLGRTRFPKDGAVRFELTSDSLILTSGSGDLVFRRSA